MVRRKRKGRRVIGLLSYGENNSSPLARANRAQQGRKTDKRIHTGIRAHRAQPAQRKPYSRSRTAQRRRRYANLMPFRQTAIARLLRRGVLQAHSIILTSSEDAGIRARTANSLLYRERAITPSDKMVN